MFAGGGDDAEVVEKHEEKACARRERERAVRSHILPMYDALRMIADDSEACTCNKRSWYGEGHDSACPVGIARETLRSIPRFRRYPSTAATAPVKGTADASRYEQLITVIDDHYPDGLVRAAAETDVADGDTLALYIARAVRDLVDDETDLYDIAVHIRDHFQSAIDDLSGIISALEDFASKLPAPPSPRRPP